MADSDEDEDEDEEGANGEERDAMSDGEEATAQRRQGSTAADTQVWGWLHQHHA